MITSTPTPDGYIFNLRDETIGVGSYAGDDGFILLEKDDTTSKHRNGMLALVHLRQKYTPEFYLQPVKRDVFMPVDKQNERSKLSKYVEHASLKGVHPLVMESV